MTRLPLHPGTGGSSPALTYDQTVLADSPVAFWPLNESSGTSAADATGNGHTGTYTGGFTLGQTGPCSDGETAVLLNGTSGYVSVPDAAALRITGAMSLEIFADPTNFILFNWLVTKTVSFPAPYEWRLGLTTGIPNLVLDNGSTFESNVASAAPSTGAWTHLVATAAAAGGGVNHYLNGSANGSSGTSVTRGDGGTAFLIGTRDDHAAFFNGSLAKVAVYNYVLTSGQVSAHYAAR